ncbi:MAG: GntR family transcriptional regulator [Peptococcaceae bacterium]
MSIGKINRKASTLREQAYDIIKTAIMSGTLKPGEALVEEQLAKDLGLSRTPLREALVLLEHDQYIEMIPYKGTFVTKLTNEEVKEIFQIRELLEPEAVCLALQHITEQEIEELKEFFNKSRVKVARGDLDTFLASNKLIHDKLLEYGENETLRRLIISYIEKIQRYQVMINAWEGSANIMDEFEEHCTLIDALYKKEQNEIRSLMISHLRNCCKRMISQLEKNNNHII